jgi:hypothetical protein
MEKLMRNKAVKVLMAMIVMWLCGNVAAMAQRHYLPHVHVGAHAGMSLSRVSFYPKAQEMNLPGATFGLSFRYAEERHVGILAELNLEQRGWKEDFEEQNAQFQYYHRTTYIELPIMTHIFFGSRVVKGFFNLGPELGYMISDGISSNFNYVSPLTISDFPGTYRQTEQMSMDITNRFDYGITAGAGIEFIIMGKHCVLLEGRYYYGLGNIFPSAKSDYFSSSRGSSLQVTLGYLFRLK